LDNTTYYGAHLAETDFKKLREKMIGAAKEGIKQAYASEEYALMQAINAYLELDRSYNLAYERLSEWYGLYFPEIKLHSAKMLANLALVLNSKASIDKNAILSLVHESAQVESLYAKASSSMGREMNDDEKEAIIKYAQLLLSMDKALSSLNAYIKVASTRLMPNTTFLTDEKIAAELLSKAGSLERLAIMPSSTVQLLGAEKALFKHIKFGSKPPKYGVLFKLSEVGTAKREMRGRIARAYASKICIALKADVYTKNFIAEGLKSDLARSMERLKRASANRPTKEKDDRKRQNADKRRTFSKP